MSDPGHDPLLPTVRAGGGDSEELAALLHEIRRAIVKHPEAFQAAMAALIAEGKAFAQTSEGSRWVKRLERSALVNRAALLWQNLADDAALRPTSEAHASQLADALFRIGDSPARDRLLDDWLSRGRP